METLLITVPDATSLLAHRIRSARRRSGWTQAELAERSLCGVATIQRLERNGTGQVLTLLRVLSALGHLRDLETLLLEPEATTLEELRARS